MSQIESKIELGNNALLDALSQKIQKRNKLVLLLDYLK